MNAAAANALLKTLEEPPAGTYLLLVSHQRRAIAGDDPQPLPAIVAAPRPTTRQGVAWLAAQGVARRRGVARAGGRRAARRTGARRRRLPGASAASWMKALAAPRALPVGGAGRAHRRRRRATAQGSRSPRRSTGCSHGAPTSRACAPGGARRCATRDRGAPRGARAVVARRALFRYHRACCDSARCSRTRCSRGSSPRRC